MKRQIVTIADIERFAQYLKEMEYAKGSMEQYLRDVRAFAAWTEGEPVTKDALVRWKEHLQGKGYQAGTVNGKLASLNAFFKFAGWEGLHLRYLKVQRRLFRSAERELDRSEYARLIETAERAGKRRLALLMETICATGIRVSEARHITAEAVRRGRADIRCKGKIRTILLPEKLCRKLQRYAKKEKISSGEIFVTRTGRGLTRRQIWAEMKSLCAEAGVALSKVYPHNLRHLFARTFYRIYKDVVRLADVLGHSSVDTTRIYLVSTGAELACQIERLGLVS